MCEKAKIPYGHVTLFDVICKCFATLVKQITKYSFSASMMLSYSRYHISSDNSFDFCLPVFRLKN